MFQIAVFVDLPDRYTRSGELVPVMTFSGYDRAYLLSQAMDLARWNKRYESKVWIGEGSW